jgi:hypothetical protein
MAKKKSADYETYVATSVRARRVMGAGAAAVASAYKIEVRFLGGLNTAQKNAFKAAADRWASVIVGDLPSVRVDGEVIDDLLILAQGTDIDGPRGILGQAGPTHIRPASAGKSKFLPVKGIMSFDTADLQAMQQDGTLKDVITHEMGHVIGIGTIWERKGLLKDAGQSTVRFVGKNARKEFGKLKKCKAADVPVENTGGPGTADGPLARERVPQRADVGVHCRAEQPAEPPHRGQPARHGLRGRSVQGRAVQAARSVRRGRRRRRHHARRAACAAGHPDSSPDSALM